MLVNNVLTQLACRSEREIGHRLRKSGDVELAMQLAGLMVSVCCVLSILSWPTKRFLFCHCLPPLRDNVKNLHIVQERDPLKKTVPSVSRMLAVKSTSAAVPIGRCWSVPSGWCPCLPQQISVFFYLHCAYSCRSFPHTHQAN